MVLLASRRELRENKREAKSANKAQESREERSQKNSAPRIANTRSERHVWELVRAADKPVTGRDRKEPLEARACPGSTTSRCAGVVGADVELRVATGSYHGAAGIIVAGVHQGLFRLERGVSVPAMRRAYVPSGCRHLLGPPRASSEPK